MLFTVREIGLVEGISGVSVGTLLDVNIYGLRARIDCFDREERENIARLLAMFLQDEPGEIDITIRFRKRETSREIGGFLFPHLARRGIWAIHAGGFHSHGGYLTVGPSDCGKSTFSHMALQQGLDLLSDDVTLLREIPQGIELLPFYSMIFLRDGKVLPKQERFKPAELTYLLMPKFTKNLMSLRKIEKKIDILKKLVLQFLWSYDGMEQTIQKRLIEKMCIYPAYEVYWNSTLFHDDRFFREMLDAVGQGKG